jgi:hypothetical protein
MKMKTMRQFASKQKTMAHPRAAQKERADVYTSALSVNIYK